MLLKIHSDASYLSAPQAQSRIGGFFYLGNHPILSHRNNGEITIAATVLKNVVASAAEAEYGGLFHNSIVAIPLRQELIDMNFPQPATPICTDNSTSNVLSNNTLKFFNLSVWT